MGKFQEAPVSGVYATFRSVFKTIMDDDILCKYLYYPSSDMNDDPTLKDNLTSGQKEEVIFITNKSDDLEGSNQIKRGRLFFALGTTQKSYSNHKFSKPTVLLYIFVPREGFQNIDFRQEAIVDRIDQLISDVRFEGSFGRLVKDVGGTHDAPKGYLGYVLRYVFANTDA